MDRKLFGLFSGWQITCVLVTAIIAPSVLYGAVSTQAVSITDPSSGAQSLVHSSRALSIYDPVAGEANDPRNYVDIDVNGVWSNTCGVIYKIPAGKALVVTAVSGNFYHNDYSRPSAYLFRSSDCNGTIKLVNYNAPEPASSAINQTFGRGVPFPAGNIAMNNINNAGYIRIHGYLVPASAVAQDAPPAVPQPRGLAEGRAF